MALKEQIQVISQDPSGRVLTLKNTTGREESGRDTGYGPVNGQSALITEYIIEFRRLESNILKTIRITPDTEYPKLSDVLLGLPFKVNTAMFEETPDEYGASMFSDGVIGLDVYSVWPGLSNVEITKGNNFIVGADFNTALLGDAIQVDGRIYQIDKTLSDIAGQILYIVGEFEEDATAFDILFRGTTKALLQAVSDNQHAYIVAKIADNSQLQQALFIPDLNTALHFKVAALGFVKTCKDWHKANDLVIGAGRILNKILKRWL